MLFISLLIQIVALALHSNTNFNIVTPLLFTRIAAIVFIYSGALSFNALYIQLIGSGIGIYSGLFHVTIVSQFLDLFIIGSLIKILWPFTHSKRENQSVNIYFTNIIYYISKSKVFIKDLILIVIFNILNFLNFLLNKIQVFSRNIFTKYNNSFILFLFLPFICDFPLIYIYMFYSYLITTMILVFKLSTFSYIYLLDLNFEIWHWHWHTSLLDYFKPKLTSLRFYIRADHLLDFFNIPNANPPAQPAPPAPPLIQVDVGSNQVLPNNASIYFPDKSASISNLSREEVFFFNKLFKKYGTGPVPLLMKNGSPIISCKHNMNVQPQIITEHSITHVFPRYAEISETDLRNGVQQNQAMFVIDFKLFQKLMIAKNCEDWSNNNNLIIDDILRFHICKRVYNQYVNHEDYNGKIPLFGLLNLLSLCGFIRQHQIDNLYTERLEVYDHFF